MTKKISILILEDIPNVGQAGDIVSVNDGYARNFLFPQGKAALADATVKQQSTEQAKQLASQHQQQLKQFQALASQLEGTELIIEARVKEGEDIFGTVTAAAISKELKNQAKIDVKAKSIQLKKPLKKTGTTTIAITLSDDVEAELKVTIVPDPSGIPADDDEY